MKKLTLLMACLILASCAILNPQTNDEKAKALKWCTGAEWVIGVTDIMADAACNSHEGKWSETGCMAYDLTASLLRSQINGVRLVAEATDDPMKIDNTMRDAQGTYHKIDSVYRGSEIQTDNQVTPFQSLFFDSTPTRDDGTQIQRRAQCGTKRPGLKASA